MAKLKGTPKYKKSFDRRAQPTIRKRKHYDHTEYNGCIKRHFQCIKIFCILLYHVGELNKRILSRLTKMLIDFYSNTILISVMEQLDTN